MCSVTAPFNQKDQFITGGKDGKIKIWNMKTGEPERILTANLGPIVDLLTIESPN